MNKIQTIKHKQICLPENNRKKQNDYLQLKNKTCFFHHNLPVRCYVFFPSTLTVIEKLLLAESIQTRLTQRSSLYSDNCSNHCKTFLAFNSYLRKTKLII
jgi:hypothetical protein